MVSLPGLENVQGEHFVAGQILQDSEAILKVV